MIPSRNINSNIKEPVWKYLSIIDTEGKVLNSHACPIGWGCRIHRLHLCRGVSTPPPRRTSVLLYDIKQTDGEILEMLQLWGMQSTLSLPLLPGPLWPGVVAPDRVQSMGQIELKCVIMLNWTAWNRSVFVCLTNLFEMELFLTLKLCLR